jgi:hypothetical protein
MPADFKRCVKNGGRVRTKDLGGGKYMHICYKDGKSYPGEILKKKPAKKEEKAEFPKKKQKKTQEVVRSALANLEDLKKLKEHFEDYMPNRNS